LYRKVNCPIILKDKTGDYNAKSIIQDILEKLYSDKNKNDIILKRKYERYKDLCKIRRTCWHIVILCK
jgi:hypothetical protein